MKESAEIIVKYENLMNEQKFHVVMNLLDGYIREINKYFVRFSKEYENNEKQYNQILVNTIQKLEHYCFNAPIAPNGTELLKRLFKCK